MTRYAERTRVPVAQSRTEIEHVLERYGADAFGYGWDDTRAVVSFRAQGRYVRFAIEIPPSPQEERQRWRALLLVIKAKLEAVESGVTTFEEEFLAHVVLPDNQTVGDWLLPQVELAYENGGMPKLLMPGTP
jgi:hypothetical protein